MMLDSGQRLSTCADQQPHAAREQLRNVLYKPTASSLALPQSAVQATPGDGCKVYTGGSMVGWKEQGSTGQDWRGVGWAGLR